MKEENDLIDYLGEEFIKDIPIFYKYMDEFKNDK